jgi:hypothetical protein
MFICFCTDCIRDSIDILIAKIFILRCFFRQNILLVLRLIKTFQSFIWMLLSVQMYLLVLYIVILRFFILIKSFAWNNFFEDLIFIIFVYKFTHLVYISKCLVFICFQVTFLIIISFKICSVINLFANNFGEFKFVGSSILKWTLFQKIDILIVLFILRVHTFSEL